MKTNKLIFLFCILMSMLTTNASAYDIAVKNANGVTIYYGYYPVYIYGEEEMYVTPKTDSYNSYSGSVVIPKEITYDNRKIKVAEIGRHAFKNCSKLNSVTIPNSVKRINWYAFQGSSIKSINIPNSVTFLGAYTFQKCTKLTSVVIGDGVKSIEHAAFQYCSNLTSVTIGKSVTSLGMYAFGNCSSLTSVTIGKSVTSIGEEAFISCSSLKSVTIPNSVTSIERQAFWGCI